MKARKFVYASEFEEEPKPSDFRIVEEELPEIQDEEILCEALYLSVDPYMRKRIPISPIGTEIGGSQVAKIIQSKNEDYPKDSYIVGAFGWRTHTIFKPKQTYSHQYYLISSFGDLSKSLGLGVLGMPGITAYFGFLEICKPKSHETVVVTGAAGAVGSVVGQIAKIKGCKVIGFAGSKQKCDWLINELGYDHAINYKTDNVVEALQQFAPNGVDCFYDNTAGDVSHAVINQLNMFGRMSVCGTISTYNLPSDRWPKYPPISPKILNSSLTLEGFNVSRWKDRWFEAMSQLQKWVEEGKLKYHETITDGFENMPHAFIGLFRGENLGKAIIKV